MKIILTCPECREMKEIELTQDEYRNYLKYKHGECFIQDMLPTLPRHERELLRGGMCGSCWDFFFGQSPWEDEDEEDE